MTRASNSATEPWSPLPPIIGPRLSPLSHILVYPLYFSQYHGHPHPAISPRRLCATRANPHTHVVNFCPAQQPRFRRGLGCIHSLGRAPEQKLHPATAVVVAPPPPVATAVFSSTLPGEPIATDESYFPGDNRQSSGGANCERGKGLGPVLPITASARQ